MGKASDVAGDSYANELNSRLVNPFIGKRPEEMFKLVDDFLNETEVEDIYYDKFRKGAFLAQDPDALRGIRHDLGLELDRDEQEALRREKENKWNQKWTMYALVGCCSLGAAVQGWYVKASISASYCSCLLSEIVQMYSPRIVLRTEILQIVQSQERLD